MLPHRGNRDGYVPLEGAPPPGDGPSTSQPAAPAAAAAAPPVGQPGAAPAGAREFRRTYSGRLPAPGAAPGAGAGRAAATANQQVVRPKDKSRQLDKFVALPDDGSSPPRPPPSPNPIRQQRSASPPLCPANHAPDDWAMYNASRTEAPEPAPRPTAAPRPAPAPAAAPLERKHLQRPAQQQQQQQQLHPGVRSRASFDRRSVEPREDRRDERQQQQQQYERTQARTAEQPPPRMRRLPSDDGGDDLVSAWRGRITVYCIADACDFKMLQTVLKTSYPEYTMHEYGDVVHVQTDAAAHKLQGELFFFDFGVIVCWGLTEIQEQAVVLGIGSRIDRTPLGEDMEVDELQFNYSANEPPHIQNDTITINKRQAGDHQVRLAISHALAQSTKLSVYEQRVIGLVEETRHLPETLARSGHVAISTKEVAKLIGKVFLQNSNVNLLSTVLDTPEFFWRAPDSLAALYDRACEYLELESRVEVLNARFQVLQEMLDMLRDHQNHSHASRLEWIIIWLLGIDVVLMLFQLASLLGWV